MNLNCLKRKDSDNDMNEKLKNQPCEKPNFGLCIGRVNRSLSGNLIPRTYEKSRSGVLVPTKKVKKSPHRIHNSGPVEFQPPTPRLVRSSGMRRDWSFEDLRQRVKGWETESL